MTEVKFDSKTEDKTHFHVSENHIRVTDSFWHIITALPRRLSLLLYTRNSKMTINFRAE